MAEHNKNVTSYRAFLKLKEGGAPPVAAAPPRHSRHRHV
jgi:hypothetical protein